MAAWRFQTALENSRPYANGTPPGNTGNIAELAVAMKAVVRAVMHFAKRVPLPVHYALVHEGVWREVTGSLANPEKPGRTTFESKPRQSWRGGYCRLPRFFRGACKPRRFFQPVFSKKLNSRRNKGGVVPGQNWHGVCIGWDRRQRKVNGGEVFRLEF
jgi:hypothetical protein